MTAIRTSSRRTRLRVPLLIALLLVTALGIGRWWQQEQRLRWLEHATLEELAAAATRDETDVEVFQRLGIRAREAEQWGRAAKAFQKAVELAPDRVDNWVGWARTVYEIDGFRTADIILSEYVRTHPQDGIAYKERAALRRVAKRREMAHADAVKATELTPDSGEAWALRGDLSLDTGIAGEADIAFNKARKLLPENSPWPYVGLYQTYIQQKRLPEALEMARLIVKRFPSVPQKNLYLGEALVENARSAEEYEQARKALLEAVPAAERWEPTDRFALEFLLGRTYFYQSRWRETRSHLERAREHVPDNPDMLFLLGRTYRALGDSARAEATLNQHRQVYENISTIRRHTARIAENPGDAKTRLSLARWYATHGALGSAGIQYEEMIARGLEVETARRELKSLEERGALP